MYRKTPLLLVCIAFLINCLGPLPQAEAENFVLPKPGVMVHLSPEFNPPVLKGLKVDPNNPFKFEFIVDKGDASGDLKDDTERLIKYFLASLTIPEKDLWVNLSPYEKDRIIPDSFGITEMGRDLLAEDYLLKQITASLIYPEDELGKKFWQRIYKEAVSKYHTTKVPMNTFNKVWIVPEKAVIFENAKKATAYIVETKFKVMLEEDYLSLKNHIDSTANTHSFASQIIREIVLPELTKEVNTGKNFAKLRQVYQSLVLALWYKKKLKTSILTQVYADQHKLGGITLDDPNQQHAIYTQYLAAFQKGVYNYIKEETDAVTNTRIAKKYFSGGVILGATTMDSKEVLSFTNHFPDETDISDRALKVTAIINVASQVLDKAKDKIDDYRIKRILKSAKYDHELMEVFRFGEDKGFEALTAIVMDDEREELMNRSYALEALFKKNLDRTMRWYLALPQAPLADFIPHILTNVTEDGSQRKNFEILKRYPLNDVVGFLLHYIIDPKASSPDVRTDVFQYIMTQSENNTPDFINTYKRQVVQPAMEDFIKYFETLTQDPVALINFLMRYKSGYAIYDKRIQQYAQSLKDEQIQILVKIVKEEQRDILWSTALRILSTASAQHPEVVTDQLLNIFFDQRLLERKRRHALRSISVINDAQAQSIIEIYNKNPQLRKNVLLTLGASTGKGRPRINDFFVKVATQSSYTPEERTEIILPLRNQELTSQQLDALADKIRSKKIDGRIVDEIAGVLFSTQGPFQSKAYDLLFDLMFNFDAKNEKQKELAKNVFRGLDSKQPLMLNDAQVNIIKANLDGLGDLKSAIALELLPHIEGPLQQKAGYLLVRAAVWKDRPKSLLSSMSIVLLGNVANDVHEASQVRLLSVEKVLERQSEASDALRKKLSEIIENQKDPSPEVRVKIIKGLRGVLRMSLKPTFFNVATNLNDSQSIRLVALEELKGASLDAEGERRIITLTSKDNSYDIRVGALHVLSKSHCSSACVDTIMAIIKDKTEEISLRAIAVLSLDQDRLTEIQKIEIIDLLKLDSKKEMEPAALRRALIMFAGNSQIKEGIEALMNAIRTDPDESLRQHALLTTGAHTMRNKYAAELYTMFSAHAAKDEMYNHIIEALSNLSPQSIAKQFKIDIKLARYVIRHKLFDRLKDETFKQNLNEIAYAINKEQTSHPAERRVGEDEKNSLFAYLFDANNVDQIKFHFDEFFLNNPESYLLDIKSLTRLLNHLSLDEIESLIRVVREDPKQSLDEIKKILAEKVKGNPHADFIVRESNWILSNLFILQTRIQQLQPLMHTLKTEGRTTTDLIALLDKLDSARSLEAIRTYAALYHVDVINLFKLKFECLTQTQREDLFADFWNKSNLLTHGQHEELSRMFDLQNYASRLRIYMKVLFMQTTNNALIKSTLDQVQNNTSIITNAISNHIKLFLTEKNSTIKGNDLLMQYWSNALSLPDPESRKAALQELRALMIDRSPARSKIPSAMTDRFARIEDLIAISPIRNQIPHIQFEPLMKLGANEKTLEVVRSLNQALNDNDQMHNQLATLKNRLLEHLVMFNALPNDLKSRTFAVIVNYLNTKYNGVTVSNAQQFYDEFMWLLEQFYSLLDLKEMLSNEEELDADKRNLHMRINAIVNQALTSNTIDVEEIKSISHRIAALNVTAMMARFKSKLSAQALQDTFTKWKFKNSADVIAELERYALRKPWTDHEGRNIFRLIEFYLTTIENTEVYQNILDALLAEVRGRFHEWKFQSQDYRIFLDQVIDLEAEKLSPQDKARFEQAMNRLEGKSKFDQLKDIKGFDSIKARIAQIRNWELGLSKENDDGTQSEFTDDFYYLFNIGNYAGSTACQNCTYGKALNRGLTGYVVNGTNKAVANIKNGRVVPARRIVRLKIAVDEQGHRQPVIFVEENAQFGVHNLDNLYEVLNELSRRMNVPLVASSSRAGHSIKFELWHNQIVKLVHPPARSTIDYSDSYGGMLERPENKEWETAYLTFAVKAPVQGQENKSVLVKQDEAMEAKGGIDLTADSVIQIGDDGKAIEFRLDPKQLEKLKNATGFIANIIAIEPMTNVREFLGVTSP